MGLSNLAAGGIFMQHVALKIASFPGELPGFGENLCGSVLI